MLRLRTPQAQPAAMIIINDNNDDDVVNKGMQISLGELVFI